jgi:phage tail-like protein
MAETYPLPAFHFQVSFNDRKITDTSFQEVSGLSQEIETEDVAEGGENTFVHRLPKSVKSAKLALKRGIAPIDSPLITWCRSCIGGGFIKPITPQGMLVKLLDETANPIRVWELEHAYPVSIEIEAFNATKNEVAIEKIEMVYNAVVRWK